MSSRTKLSLILVLTILGMINAFYLSYEAWVILQSQNSIFGSSFCDINSTFSCTSFMAHEKSRIFGIPFPWIAGVVYPILFGLSVFALIHKNLTAVKIITMMAFGGLIFNGFVISQELSIGVFCPLCLMCTGYILTIAILGTCLWKGGNEKFLK